jgi:cytochrome c biogenesis protein CcmG, thiol:disulfide interchange protein DsbE
VRRIWVSLVLGTLIVGCDRGDHPGNVDKSAPEFVVSDGARTADLNKLRGKVVVLNLWATNCGPCVEELPSLLALQRKMPDLAVVAVSWDDDPDAYRHFLTRYHVDLFTVRDPDQKVANLYGTKQIPETYIIDRQGMLRRKFVGAQDWTSPEITGYLRKL